MNTPIKKWPFGLITACLVGLALVIQFIPQSSCEQLEVALDKQFFIQWASPNLLVVQAEQAPKQFSADNKEAACALALEAFKH